MFDQHTLAIIYVCLMGLSVILYAILDGYDLGVGMLLPLDNQSESDIMVASIGPFWDANETWLVLAIGLLLIAFPQAHSLILKELYIPASVMLIGLILRGVAFDFRAKASFGHKPSWDKAFKFGSFIAALSQGFMLGLFVTGFDKSLVGYSFAILSALGVCAAYCFIGAMWLTMKAEGELQIRSIKNGKKMLIVTFIGVIAVSLTNLALNPQIYLKWFTWPNSIFLVPIPVICTILFVLTYMYLKHLQKFKDQFLGLPFIMTALIFVFSFAGLGYSFFPYIVPQHLTIWETVAAPESLNFLLYGAIVVVPTILAYTAYSYRVFWGKCKNLGIIKL
ncbi:cytochrome d ubiquinol oxidase subunit II [Psychrosphaera algicola]|uniref:Cytochrome d ubiquinol oxidase subunit II n=1 Tax=Psychrosphaera algicola TaxID=3023714 RepID=A0ABT5F9D1_9GAMM|nr:cytochrome d ubiquinol oxidase subunit II [Psychrosphaera sp. G1-22]MDC2888136.1 cytochrome d ubiquinol oxidase subunit II [Psychrosphaera sp. G1-22]